MDRKEVQKFTGNVTAFLSALKQHPEMCRPSTKRKHVRVGILSRPTQLVYHYNTGTKQIQIYFFGTLSETFLNSNIRFGCNILKALLKMRFGYFG